MLFINTLRMDQCKCITAVAARSFHPWLHYDICFVFVLQHNSYLVLLFSSFPRDLSMKW